MAREPQNEDFEVNSGGLVKIQLQYLRTEISLKQNYKLQTLKTEGREGVVLSFSKIHFGLIFFYQLFNYFSLQTME